MNPPDARVRKIVTLFERLAPADLPRLPEIYTRFILGVQSPAPVAGRAAARPG